MSLTNPNKVVTEERLNEYHKMILPYLGGNSMVACGGGYAPIGTVIAYMGTRAPSDFLICDGTVYNIADYTELADFFELQFGSANFFGGDGNTTFAVPDLRGEFLRGTGTNSHTNQGSGANVGVHQDGTEHLNVINDDYNMTYSIHVSGGASAKKMDSEIKVITDKWQGGNNNGPWAGENPAPVWYTSRPTNTSVLYCIKAKSQGNGCSLDEQIVGTWIDGKPIYQKTWSGLSITGTEEYVDTNIDISFVDRLICGIINRGGSNTAAVGSVNFKRGSNNHLLYDEKNGFSNIDTITLQYTKTTD